MGKTVRSTCTRCCRCPTPSWRSAPPIRRRWPGSPPIDRLRQVALRPGVTAGRRLPRDHAVIGYGFFTAGETPYRAITTLGARFPALRFALVPRPAD